MIILGLFNAAHSGAALIIDGTVIASVNEERFSRIKDDRGFPSRSLQYCLAAGRIDLQEVTHFACGAWAGLDESYLPHVIDEVMDFARDGDSETTRLIHARSRVAVERDSSAREEMLRELKKLGVDESRVSFYDHHLSHAHTAFYPSPFDEALVLTIDGRGDFKSATISRATRADGIRLLDSVSMFNSLGAFYGFITNILGFTPDRHEGKVTGLAASGDPLRVLPVFERMIGYRDGTIKANVGRSYTPFMTGSLPDIEAELKHYSREDIAAGAQRITEEITISYLRPFIAQTGLCNVCLAGGVFSNVRLNQRIRETPGVDNVYVFPHMGDGGSAFGGALVTLYDRGERLASPLNHVYLGPSFTDEEILKALNRHTQRVTWVPLRHYGIQRVADDLVKGVVVGLFTQRMEFGPRSLGARTIMARATQREINADLNRRLSRTEFMPFAPVTLEECASEYYVGWRPDHVASYFMTMCYECTDKAMAESPAVVHVDNTARPQIINRQMNPLYYDIIRAYYERTGIATLINTSFNNHEEPIVCSPNDAIESLLLDNVDYVILEGRVVTRVEADVATLGRRSGA